MGQHPLAVLLLVCSLALFQSVTSQSVELRLQSGDFVVQTNSFANGLPYFSFWQFGSSKVSQLFLRGLSEVDAFGNSIASSLVSFDTLTWAVENVQLVDSTCETWEDEVIECPGCDLGGTGEPNDTLCQECVAVQQNVLCTCVQQSDGAQCTCSGTASIPCVVTTFSLSDPTESTRWSAIKFSCRLQKEPSASFMNVTMEVDDYVFLSPEAAGLVLQWGAVFPPPVSSPRGTDLYYEGSHSFVLAAPTASVGTGTVSSQMSHEPCVTCVGESDEMLLNFYYAAFEGPANVVQQASFGINESASASPSGNGLDLVWQVLIGVGAGMVALSFVVALVAVLGYYRKKLRR